MSLIFLPRLFRRSCEEHEEYPLKLVGRSRYGVPLLIMWQQRLEERRQRQNLFVTASEISIPYWDVLPTGQVAYGELHSEQDVMTLLGDGYQVNQNDPNLVQSARKDQICRFLQV